MAGGQSQSLKKETRNQPSGNLDPDENPQAKRRRLFNKIASMPVPPEPDPAAALIDGLSDDELRECYDIDRSALAAQFKDRKMTPDVMEDFLKLVFDGWRSDNSAPKVATLDSFPFTPLERRPVGPVGDVILGKLSPFFLDSIALIMFRRHGL